MRCQNGDCDNEVADGIRDCGSHGRKPSPIMRFFVFAQLPPALQAMSRPFCELAEWADRVLPDGPEKSVALRKLLESKDAAVRAAL